MINKTAENTYEVYGALGPIKIVVKPELNQFWLDLMKMDEGLQEQRRALKTQELRFETLLMHFTAEALSAMPPR